MPQAYEIQSDWVRPAIVDLWWDEIQFAVSDEEAEQATSSFLEYYQAYPGVTCFMTGAVIFRRRGSNSFDVRLA